jgi:hypothetical protein
VTTEARACAVATGLAVPSAGLADTTDRVDHCLEDNQHIGDVIFQLLQTLPVFGTDIYAARLPIVSSLKDIEN